ncbi:hypothetical protein [Microbispora sp. NPDC049125]|uniref:hypothetical protein n=1 Tax=Microbispora sp. NPDC049125 TaxID=3154929 RepID=UPI0034660E0D
MEGGYAGINPDAMDEMERGLGRAEDVLGRNEPLLRQALDRVGIDVSGLGVLRETRSWIGSSRPDLRRRTETIRAERTKWTASGVLPGGLTAFDETLYGKTAHDPDVYAAVKALIGVDENGQVDARTVAELEKRTGDATFTTALMNALGPARYRQVMTQTTEDLEGKRSKRLQIALGKALGTASSHLTAAWRDGLMSGDRVGWQEGYAIALALKHGTYDTRFLTSVARKIDAWDRKASQFPAALDPGVMEALMEALARDPAAAQDFFTGDDAMLKHYLTERRVQDRGLALGKALEAAMLTFRDHDGSPQHPSRGYLSAKLMSEFVHLQAERIETGRPPESLVPPVTTGHLLAGYIADIDNVAQKGGRVLEAGVRGAGDPNGPGKNFWGVQFNKEELGSVMKETFADSKAFAPVLIAQTSYTAWLLDHGAAAMAAGRGDDALLTTASQTGAGFGMITDAAGLAKIEEGKELDETQAKNMQILMAVVNTGLAIPQAASWAIGAGIVGALSGLAEDAVNGDAESKARSDANAAVDQTRTLLNDLTAQAMLRHGVFGSADPPAKTHPWASLEGLKKGDDPRDNPNNFLKADGLTIMTMKEMIDESATNSVDKYRKVEAYDRWLYDGLAGKPWRDVQGRLNMGFSTAFAQYG